MIASLSRSSAPLAWLRVRLRASGDSTGAAAAHGRAWAELLPRVPVDGVPLHRALAVRAAVLTVAADACGVVAHVVAPPDRGAEVVEVLDRALRTPLEVDLMRTARKRATLAWRWIRDDSEALADAVADSALHRSQWAGAYDDLVIDSERITEAAGELTPLWAHSMVYVGPTDFSPDLSSFSGAQLSDDEELGEDRARLDLEVVSDGSALIRLGWRTPPRSHADFAALASAAYVVGGHHHARLTREFRVKRGWSYSPWALLRSSRHRGMWQVAVRVPVGHVAETMREVRSLVTESRCGRAEHSVAVAHAAAETRRLWSSGDSTASLVGYWQDVGLDVETEKDRWLSALAATSPADIDAAVSRWLSGPPQLEMILS